MSLLQNSNAISSGSYDINNSLRFRRSASAYLNRTFSTPTNNKIWTWSGWVKRGALGTGTGQTLIGYGVSGTLDSIGFNSSEQLSYFSVDSGGVTQRANYNTTAVFRDPSAWYHIVVAVDTTQATASNRFKLYVNGVQQTVTTTTSLALNWNTYINSALSHGIAYQFDGTTNYLDGYLTETNFIDGQALTPSDFGETDTTTGSWKPKAYSGTYGTNGFYLKFSDIATTSGSNAGLGKDFSGNTNYWTTNNISVTAGTTYDAMLDVPTNTSATVANYAVLNPLFTGGATLTNGNLSAQSTSAAYKSSVGTITFPTSGKYYLEATIVSNNGSGNNQQMGIADASNTYNFVLDCFYSGSLIRKGVDGVITTGYGTASNGMVIGIAVDATNGKAYLAINNTWIDSSSPTGGTGGYSMTAGIQYFAFFLGYNSGVSAYNFGQRPFSYTPPTGFVALNTFNLPTPTILQGNKYMDATLYTGTGSSLAVVNAAGFRPDFVWMKERSSTSSHQLFDVVRGATKNLESNTTSAEGTFAQTLTSFNANGFSLGTDSAVNENTQTYVGWQWQAGQGSTSSNTSGSITSTVSVNATAGFSVVTYTGTGANATVGHGLGVAPKMIIVKQRNTTRSWYVYHASLASAANYLVLDSTAAAGSDTTLWNNTAPTSSVFSLGANIGGNQSTGTYVAYCWAEIAGFSKFGSYTGNGSTDGPFVFTNFRPKYIMYKRTDATQSWIPMDTSRSPSNVADKFLIANNSDSEYTGTILDMLSNGFKVREAGTQTNASGGTYIYMAFAENPFKNSNAR